jgi:signal transduction histidine kinase
LKLLTKTNIYTSVTTIILFAIGVFVVFKVILIKLDSEQDEQLLSAKEIIIKSLKEGKSPELFSSNIGEKIKIVEIYKQTTSANIFKEYYEETIGEEEEEESIIVRELNFQCSINDKAYVITVSKSLSEEQEIGEYVVGIVVLFLFVSMIILFLLYRYISAYIFSPFYDTLSKIKSWNIKKSESLSFKDTDIEEFHLLNDTIEDLTQQIQSDYRNLKEFTENVSHEAQTPLSIISTKVELLMQEKNYSNKQHEAIQQIFQATQRLYKLNQVLILMSRIENKQFVSTENINLVDCFEEKLEELEDFIEAKQIIIKKEFNKNVSKDLNPVLSNILFNNLFINAIKYNLENGGTLKITLDDDSFSIENTSDRAKIDKQFLFERFTKSSTSASLGVGLSLIKKIIDYFNWQITYSHKDGVHKFKIYL